MPFTVINLVTNFLILTFLGLMIAFSPILIIVYTVIVLTTKRPILNAIILIAGVAAPLLLIALIANIFIDPNTTINFSDIAEKVSLPAIVDIIFGLALFVVGFRRVRNGRSTEQKEQPFRAPPDNPKSLFIFGFFKSLLSVTNIFAILLVVQIIKAHSRQPFVDLLAILWTILIGVVPLLLIIYYRQFRPQSIEKLSDRINGLLRRNLQLILIILIFVGSSYFFVSGLRSLH